MLSFRNHNKNLIIEMIVKHSEILLTKGDISAHFLGFTENVLKRRKYPMRPFSGQKFLFGVRG